MDLLDWVKAMSKKDDILNAAITIAQRQKHGHVTSEDISDELNGKYTKLQINNGMRYLDVWRTGIPRQTKNGHLIRELLFEYWKPKIPSALDQIKELRDQIKELQKKYDTLKSINFVMAKQQVKDRKELDAVRTGWRVFNNLMVQKR